MHQHPPPRLALPTQKTALIVTTLAGLMLVGCGHPSQMASPAADGTGGTTGEMAAASPDAAGSAETVAEVPEALPQLVKTATMNLEVESVPTALDAIATLSRQQGGDITGLDESTPTGNNRQHTAWVELRIPQANLDATLTALEELGTLRNQQITAEDVSNQLVDFEARLNNLRKTEAMLLDIMDRAGGMTDVLQVAQELSNVRQAIEELDAQLASLRSRVAFSTIRLNLQADAVATADGTSVGEELQDNWGTATRSLGNFTVGMLKVLTWLAVYSPYMVVLVIMPWWLWRRLRVSAATTALSSPNRPSDMT